MLAAQQAWLPFEAGGEDVLTLTENIVLTEAGGAALRAGYPEGYIATGKFSRTFKNAVSSTVCLPYAISSVSGKPQKALREFVAPRPVYVREPKPVDVSVKIPVVRKDKNTSSKGIQEAVEVVR